MLNSSTEIIQDISLLYELSLSIGKSLVLKENCNSFLKTLMARKNFTFVGVWLKDAVIPSLDEPKDFYKAVYAHPNSLLKNSIIPTEHKIIQKIQEKKFLCYSSQEHNKLLKVGKRFQEDRGVFVIFRLGELGFLKLYSSVTNQLYSELEMNKLYSVITKFTMSIQACLEHEKAIIEAGQRVKTEKELIEKDKLYVELVKNLQEGFVITDKEDHILFTNETMALLTGYSIDEMIGQKAYQLFLPHEKWGSFEKRQGQRISGKSETYEIEQFCKDGSKIWVQIQASPHRGSDGKIIGTFALVSNITTRKRAEIAVQESERKLSLIIDTALDAVITIDGQSRITQWNRQAKVIFGWRSEEVLGKFMHEVIMPKRHKETHIKGMEYYFETGYGKVLNQRIEISALRKSGEEFPIELAIAPIKFRGKTQFSAFVRDITERRNAETDLIEAKKTAEESVKAKELFLAKMSHEIRTPMNAILGLTDLSLRTALNKVQKKYLEAIHYSANNLLVIINDILDFTKINADKLVLEQITFDLEGVLENIHQLVSLKSEEKGILFTYELDANIQKFIIGDPVRLNQTLLNIVNNAIKFTDEGSVRLDCELHEETPTQQCLLFKITDTGSGISEQNLAHIFDSFAQGDLSVNRRYGGTGLGLTISKQLVELMGGTIQVESSLVKGTCFSFTAYFKKSNQLALNNESTYEEVKDYSGYKILLVEDNKINSFYASTILEQRGFFVETAENGFLALDKLKNDEFHLILMDIQMPLMNGIESTTTIRNTLNLEIPIIALTANAYQEDLDRYKEIGMNDYIIKPFDEKNLFEKINIYLDTDIFSQQKIEKKKQEEIPENNLYSLDKLRRDTQNNIEFLKKMMQIFITETPIMLSEMEKHYSTLEYDKMSKIAHKLKSSIDLMGIESIRETIREIEKQVPSEEETLEKILFVKNVCKKVIEQLHQEINSIQ